MTRNIIPHGLSLLAAMVALTVAAASASAANRKPNFVIVLCDDLGYGDIEPYGGSIPTPALKRMAKEGLVATDYYCPGNVCTPSRSGLLTGRYPVRTGLGYEVIFEADDRGLPLTEKTIAAALKPEYATGIFGKWHLGHQGNGRLPTSHGFDTFFGIPYSHDMKPLPVYDMDAKTGKATNTPADLPQLQQQFYAHAEKFIEANHARPFFVYLALSAPHLPNYPPPDFKGKSPVGAFGDCVMECDAIVGRLLDKLKELNLDRDTVVVFTSDNGPWFEGSSGPLRDRKGGAGYDGGYRVPFIVWAPGLVKPGGKTDAIICGIDLLPTFCKLAGHEPPKDVTIDGLDISGVLTKGEKSPHESILLFDNEDIVAIRTQKWKYVDKSYYRSHLVDLGKHGAGQLHDTMRDVGENYSLNATYPEQTQEMQKRLKTARATFDLFKKGVPPRFKEMMEQRLKANERKD